MLKIEEKSSGNKKTFLIILSGIIFLAGIYGLFLTIYPMVKLSNVNPENNSTVAAIKETQETKKITENRLYIPKIDVNVPYEPGDESVMENGAWWRKEENGNPADGGNFVISAHRFLMGFTPEQTWRKSPFYNIGKLEEGDQIVVDYNGKRYFYKIAKKHAVSPDAVEIESRTEKPQMTLYTCTFGGASDGRDVFVAVVDSVFDPENPTQTVADVSSNSNSENEI